MSITDIPAEATEKATTTSSNSWLFIRDQLVQQATDDEDLELLRRLAALPGGFGSDVMRRRAWLFLLHANEAHSSTENPKEDAKPENADDAELEKHRDEGQVGLDTARSFVTYPTGIPRESKEALQADLHNLIVGVLGAHPRLSYFQGYHDILSVLYLTFIPPPILPTRTPPRSRSSSRTRRKAASGLHLSGISTPVNDEEDRGRSDVSRDRADEKGIGSETSSMINEAGVETTVARRDTFEWGQLRRCSEALSLLRVRDAMGSGMEAMMGYLRLLRRLLRAADPDLARFSSRISPVPTLPFFALSWILCLFSHDVDTLEPVQRMFDFLLSRNPISAIYLAVAILIAKKPQMLALAKQLGPDAVDDPTLLHPLFSRLPPLFADTPDRPIPPQPNKAYPDLSAPSSRNEQDPDPNPYDPIPLSRCFALADELIERYPWNGPIIRGQEILGAGSVVVTYEKEREEEDGVSWREAESFVDRDVVKVDVPESDDEEEEDTGAESNRLQKRRKSGRTRMSGVNRLGMVVAVGVMLVGIGVAVYTSDRQSGWVGWWGGLISRSRRLGTMRVMETFRSNLRRVWSSLGGNLGRIHL